MPRVEIENRGDYKFKAKSNGHEFNITTKGEGFSPLDTLLASLGSCIGVYMRKYAEGSKVGLPEFMITVEGELSKEAPVSFRSINVSIDLKNSQLDERRKKSLLSFIQNCPIHNTLKGNPEVRISI